MGKWVVAGDATHYCLDEKLVCGCTLPIMPGIDPVKRKPDGTYKFRPFVCQGCVEANTKRWEEAK